MRKWLSIVALLGGCDFPSLSINCQTTGVSLVCGWVGLDAGTDGGLDAGTSDSGVSAGPVDAGVAPVKDASAPAVVDASQPSTQPATGVFKVQGSKLFDANGNEFRMRGDNVTHVDAPVTSFNANTSRFINYFADDPDRVVRDMRAANGWGIGSKKVQVPGDWIGTCKSDSGSFETAIARWVANIPKYKAVERFMILNPLNEWGSDEVAWRDAYVSAIPRLRAAGWTGTILIDAPGCAQNGMAIARHGAAILASDPLKNVAYGWHTYGAVFDSQGGIQRSYAEQVDLVPTADALKATGLVVIMSEIGPGRNIGPSPTMIAPERFVDVAESHGFGWLLWSSNDNDSAGCASSETSFGMIKVCGVYNSDTDLTQWGRQAKALWDKHATQASIF